MAVQELQPQYRILYIVQEPHREPMAAPIKADDYQQYLNEDALALAQASEEIMRAGGSTIRRQEHLFLALSSLPELEEPFKVGGINRLALEQRFGYSTGGATGAGEIQTDPDVHEIFYAATITSTGARKKADVFNITRAALRDRSRRLTGYILMAGRLDPGHLTRFKESLDSAEIAHRAAVMRPNAPRSA